MQGKLPDEIMIKLKIEIYIFIGNDSDVIECILQMASSVMYAAVDFYSTQKEAEGLERDGSAGLTP